MDASRIEFFKENTYVYDPPQGLKEWVARAAWEAEELLFLLSLPLSRRGFFFHLAAAFGTFPSMDADLL
eukprot:scaffold18205_cov29-Tisochrysis_lutea.AAC.1